MQSQSGDAAGQKKLRIAICGGRGIPSTYSGNETFFGELAPRLVQRGHEVIVYCRRSLFPQRPSHYQGVRLIYLPSLETKNLSTPTHTLACMLDVPWRGVDVLLIANVGNALHCIIPRLFRIPCALNVDGVEWKRGKWSGLGRRYFYWNARLAGKILPRGIVTDAFAMRRLYLEEFGTASACIAYGGTIETSSKPDIVRSYGLQPVAYYLVLGRMVPENNAALIVEAFRKAQSQRLLAIVGDANYRSRFVDHLKANAGDNVRFLGHVGNPEHVKELYCNAYAYIHGHTVGGTNPALLQALGYGDCILAHRNPFNAEVLADYGLYFRDAEQLSAAIDRLEADPALAQRLRQRAPERIRLVYNWERITDQYEELFWQLAAGADPTKVHSSVTEAREQESAALALT